tara:strand:- start:636 stop:1061 length:426 start_codon:yes stop_codon:yes gene_type:complete
MSKSPMKFGLGEYSDEPFELKSGNTPLFKHVGSSPYRQEDNDENGDDNGNGEEKPIGKGWQMAIQGLTAGLDAVYGTGKVEFEGGKVKKKETEEEKKKREAKEEVERIKNEEAIIQAPTENIVQEEINKKNEEKADDKDKK